jgi:hypothetical protein
LIYRSLGPDLPSVTMDDALNGSQSYSGAFKLFSKMQALKYAEQLVYILHVETRAIVPHEYLDFILVSGHTANLDFGLSPQAREFDRIGNKVDNNQLQHGTVSETDWKRADLPGNVPTLRLLPEFCDHLFNKLLQVHRHLFGLGTSDPGKRQQIVNQVAHSFS